jgi:hypothetical protein
MVFKIEVRNRETKEWETQLEADAPSRRKFLKVNAEQAEVFRRGRQQWRVVHE